jgi:molybdenum cofactor biosynthesis enzyme MoaA
MYIAIDQALSYGNMNVKVNCVIMRGVNDYELVDFVEMTRYKNVEVRFIEYMPFDGNRWSHGKFYSYKEMTDTIKVKYPTLGRIVVWALFFFSSLSRMLPHFLCIGWPQ